MAPFPGLITQLSGGKLITMNNIHHGRGQFFVLTAINILDMDLLSLNAMLLPKLPFIYQNALSTTMVFHTASD